MFPVSFSLGQWTKQNLRKTAFKNLKGYCLLKQTISLQIFQRLFSTNLTCSILEYFFPTLFMITYHLQNVFFHSEKRNLTYLLSEKCPITEFFLVRIFLYSDWIQENTEQKKLCIWTLFTKWFSKTLACFIFHCFCGYFLQYIERCDTLLLHIKNMTKRIKKMMGTIFHVLVCLTNKKYWRKQRIMIGTLPNWNK